MSKLFDETIAEVRKLPATEQDAAAGVLIAYMASRRDTLLSDEQLAEVRRRRADPDQHLVSQSEARAFIKHLIS